MMILQPFSRILSGDFDLTQPVIALLSATLVTMVLAIAGNWEAATVIFIYWAQEHHYRHLHRHYDAGCRYYGHQCSNEQVSCRKRGDRNG